MATSKNKKETINSRFDAFVGTTKELTKAANDFALESAEDALKTGIKRTADWQLVGEKALQGGLKLAAAQQDLMFDSLDIVKAQFKKGQERFSTLFSNN